MKKIYFLLSALIIGSGSFAQTVANAGMESWRTNTTGSGPTVTIHAPASWYGFDSLVIADEETLLPLFGGGYMPTNLHAQLFQEPTIVHGGSSSAKVMTLKQDTIGFVPGVLSNAQPVVNTSVLIATMSLTDALGYSGGTAITGRIASVSAWVQYKAGVDGTGVTGVDSGELVVTVSGQVSGAETVVGTATLTIGPATSWTEVTANVIYTDTVDGADTIQMQFSSSTQTNPLDSSTLYVDDVTMAYVNAGIKNVNAQNDIKIYPNPASGMLNIVGAGNAVANFQLYDMSGQLVASKTLTGKDAIDVSQLPDGLYFYSVSDVNGDILQRGKVNVLK